MDKFKYKFVHSNWDKVCLVFILLYFGCVRPDNHIHYSHFDQIPRAEINPGPVDIQSDTNSDHHSDHHQDRHHHHTFNQGFDWFKVRSNAENISTAVNLPDICGKVIYGFEPWPWLLLEKYSFPESLCGFPFISRGPPAKT